MINIKLAEIVRTTRAKSGKTVLEVAEELGCTVQFVYSIEKGVVNISPVTLGRLSTILKLKESDMSDLLVAEFKKRFSKEFRRGKEEQKYSLL